jgi:hypothetical protein
MPWKERYTISDEKSLLDSEISWPEGQALLLSYRRRPQPALWSCGHRGEGPDDA